MCGRRTARAIRTNLHWATASATIRYNLHYNEYELLTLLYRSALVSRLKVVRKLDSVSCLCVVSDIKDGLAARRVCAPVRPPTSVPRRTR